MAESKEFRNRGWSTKAEPMDCRLEECQNWGQDGENGEAEQDGRQERDPPSDIVVQCGRLQSAEETPGNGRESSQLSSGMEVKFRLKRIARKNRKNPNRQRLVAAIKRKVREDYLPNRRGMWQQYRDGVFIASLNIFDWFTPSRPRRGTLWVTPILLILALVVFAFMAGAYPLYLALEGEGEDIASLGWEPKTVLSFMEGGIHGGRKFTFNFLLKWGGRYLPNIAQGEAYRWFTSVILHQSTMHLLSNGIIFIFIGSHLELKYGGLCVLWTIVLAGMGGNFLSALMEAHCSMVVGASGIVFGLVAFGLADLVFDKEANPTILARVFAGVMVTLFFIMTFVLKEYSSHVSHLGGFICGLVPSLLFHKSLVNEVIEAGTVWGVLGFLLIYFSIIPSVLYSHVLSNLTC